MRKSTYMSKKQRNRDKERQPRQGRQPQERQPRREEAGKNPQGHPVNPFEKKEETPQEKAAEKEQADLEQMHKEADTERD
jgi:hypothetical protein